MSRIRSKRATLLITSLLTLGLLLGSLAFATEKTVTIEADGSVLETKVLLTSTVGDVLDQNQIVLGDQDLVEPSRETAITEDLEIKVTRAISVMVRADGTSREVRTTPVDVLRVLTLAGLDWDDNDILKIVNGQSSKEVSLSSSVPSPLSVVGESIAARSELSSRGDSEVNAPPSWGPNQIHKESVIHGDDIELIRVTQREFAVDEPIAYEVEKTVDATMEPGTTKILQQGKSGLARDIFLITCHNGQEVQRERMRTDILVQPQNQVIAMGESFSVSRGGQRFDFREARNMESTAYTYTGNRTATGVYPAVGMVAVDPRVIPLGSKMYIEGYGYATATDTGGAIKGNKIDLFMETYSQCMNWGRRNVKVYLLH